MVRGRTGEPRIPLVFAENIKNRLCFMVRRSGGGCNWRLPQPLIANEFENGSPNCSGKRWPGRSIGAFATPMQLFDLQSEPGETKTLPQTFR